MDRNWPKHFGPSRVTGRPIIGGPGNDIPGYASNAVGFPTLPGSPIQPIERVRMGFLDLVFENWAPFTQWIVDRFLGPQRPLAAWQSPISFYGDSEKITREGSFPAYERPFPYPYMIGSVSGFMPMQDQYSLDWAWGKNPFGPGINTPVPIAWQTSYPDLQKVTG